MKSKKRIWVSDHAYERFVERILAPEYLMYEGPFANKHSSLEIIKDLSRKALENGLIRRKQGLYRVPWPYSSKGIKGIYFVIDVKRGTVITCWPDQVGDHLTKKGCGS